MKGKNKYEKEMQQLAEAGWKQMHETLREHGLSSDAVVEISHKKNSLLLFIAACLILLMISLYPFILNDHSDISTKSATSEILINKPGSVLPPKKSLSQYQPDPKVITQEEKIKLHEKLNEQLLKTKKEMYLSDLQIEKASLIKKMLSRKNYRTVVPASCGKIDTVIHFQKINMPSKKVEQPIKRVRIFAGAGMNISFEKNKSNSFLENINIHPGVSVIFPLTARLSLHSGLWALSTIHGKEVSAKEKELMNNISGNFYYDVRTTSIVKTSYFDVPLTLHYTINKNWSVGTGMQLSKLYKVNIREQKESYDYNNTLFSATTQQFNSSPTRAIAVFQKKVDIKKLETRFIVESNFETPRFLFSAGYYYGLGKTILVHDSYNSTEQYRNEYFKLGIQYRINGKGN